MSLQPGSVVSGYTIERQIGSGGMGSVFLARHPTLPRSDALKVLSAELSRDDQFRSRFLREADLAATLDHPNVVRVYTRGQSEDGQLWIAMQFVDGTDADAALKAGAMTPVRAVHIIAEVAKALDYAHSRNVLHRDVKPANFLLTGEPGPRERVLLADFGIARALDDATRLTATGSVMVTVAYASPESLQGRPVDYRSDIYSLGCTLYRLLTGRAPYGAAGTTSAVMMAHVSAPPPRVTEVMPGLPPALDEVIATALAKDPAQRYGSARELAAAAAQALGLEDPTPVPSPAQFSGPVSGPYTAPTPTTAPPTPPFAPAYSGPPGASGPALTYPSTAAYPGPAVTPKKKSKKPWIAAGAALAVVAAVVAAIALWPASAPVKPPYPAQTFTHAYGTTQILARPNAVAALTLADADAALSLGVQPVALVAPGGTAPSWLAPLITGTPTVLGRADPTAVAALKPDLIIDTAADRAVYDALTKVAPTIPRPPAGNKAWTPQTQLNWIAQVLGEQPAAATLAGELGAANAQLRQQQGFDGTSAAVLSFSPSGLSIMLPTSPAAGYLSGLGFRIDTGRADTAAAGQSEVPLLESGIYGIEAQLVLVLRSDPGARGGGFAGLPSAMTALRGKVVIVDNPETIAALTSAGPAATRYLNTTLVPQLAKQLK